ncbi:MAG: GTP-binding protein [Clostridiaceae bacterium]
MTEFYLVTGFLGAGKTTLIRSLLPALSGRRASVIVNEFGASAPDEALLGGLGAEVFAVTGGSIFCACRIAEFEDALESALRETPDVLIVEASGLSDPRTIRTATARYEREGILRYRGAICLTDAVRFTALYETARSVKRQLAVADLVLLNKSDLVSAGALAAVEARIRSVCPARVLKTTYAALPKAEFDSLMPLCESEERVDTMPDLTLQRDTVQIDPRMTPAQMLDFLTLLCEDTYRMKGILTLSDGVYLADCVGTDLRLCAYEGKSVGANTLTLLAGEGMPLRQTLREAIKRYEGLVKRIIG